MNPATPVATESRVSFLLRLLVRVALAVVMAALSGLVLCVLSPVFREKFAANFGLGDPAKADMNVVVLVAIGQVVLAGTLSWLGRRLRWRALAGVAVAVGAVLAYLAVDAPRVLREASYAGVLPDFPEAEASYAVLIRYGKAHRASREFKGPTLRWALYDPEKPQPWIDFVTQHRAEIEAEWAALAPVRAWWTELNGFDHVVDLMQPRLDGELVAFSPVRALAQRACAIATLQALDGEGDAAMATLLPLIEVSRKLQETGRSLVLQMISIVVERTAMQTADFTLARTSVSAGQRARLVAVLTKPGGGGAGARRLVAVERILAHNAILNSGLEVAIEPETGNAVPRWLLRVLDPFVYNPRATVNLLDGFLVDAEDLIGRRQLEAYGARVERFMTVETRLGFKNLGGRMLALFAVPAYGKVAESFWKVQDQRAALLAKLNPPDPAP